MERSLMIIYLINCILAILGIFVFLFTMKLRTDKLKTNLPRNLRIYIELFLYPPCVIICLSSISTSLFYVIFQKHGLFFNYDGSKYLILLPTVLSFVAQIFRMGLLMIVLERIIASIFVKRYNNNSNFGLAVMITVTIASTVGYVGFVFFSTSNKKFLQLFTTYFVLFMHVLTFITCKALYLINRNTYKRRAYQSSLKERYQIVENVKVLSFIYPTIFIFTIVAPTGPLIIFISNFLTPDPLPPSMFHLSYNLAFVIMMLYRLLIIFNEKRRKQKPGPIYAIAVISPLGKALPASQQIDSYFESLQKQWE